MNKQNQSKALPSSIGQRLAEVRREILHLSQQKLADQVGVKLRTVQRYEADENLPPESFYERMLKINRLININWIKTGNGSMYNLTDPTTSFQIDFESVIPTKEGDCWQKLQLAIAEIKMLRAALAYKDSLLNILVNQTVTS